ncbi:MAG: phosphopantothenoylcysteine decarboxylase / phosphopantothenate---cysteine ligase, partial [Actinomycetota bacterium]|nr:phosphopantothenoylcysteine decarboxylase / phosphopantothenate---cysteine ligase [Actinomycetota bacterium]
LTATLLATRAPVLVCPAMHTEMWEHPAVQENLSTLRRRGVHVLDPEEGRLAGGDVGAGRLADPARIADEVLRLLAGVHPLTGRTIVVTAGGTREAVDPVRYVGNRSSGKMGHALANVALRLGARVVLITTANQPVAAGVEVVAVESAQEMHDAVMARSASADAVIMAAAVADFRPKAPSDHKIKKADGVPEIVLEPTTDILAALGRAKRPGQMVVGFAAETERLREHAAAKLAAKRVDLMVANDVSAPDAGFEVDTNRAVLLAADGSSAETQLLGKEELAAVVLARVVTYLGGPLGGPST